MAEPLWVIIIMGIDGSEEGIRGPSRASSVHAIVKKWLRERKTLAITARVDIDSTRKPWTLGCGSFFEYSRNQKFVVSIKLKSHKKRNFII